MGWCDENGKVQDSDVRKSIGPQLHLIHQQSNIMMLFIFLVGEFVLY